MDDGFQSEIRESEIQALEDKVASSDYGQYLRRVTLTKVRAFSEREVRFDFPVTALVGPNGGGKTTVLGAAGIIYRTVAPSRFFAKSGAYDASMTNWRIEYELVDRSLNPRLPVQRTASFLKLKWNRTAVERRQVLILGVTRTVPASERRELAKAVGSSFVANSTVTLSKAVVDAVQAVLGKPMEGYNRLNVDELGRGHLFAAVTSEGSYSEFHFGAGEASIIRMISEIEEASDNCLILIEEIENGLHPVATRRMVEYLIDVARRKSAQVIFTSHSNDALAPLPGKAIWAAFDGEVMQGKLDVRALRTITGQVDAALAVYVEDEFAELMLRVALTSEQGIANDGHQDSRDGRGQKGGERGEGGRQQLPGREQPGCADTASRGNHDCLVRPAAVGVDRQDKEQRGQREVEPVQPVERQVGGQRGAGSRREHPGGVQQQLHRDDLTRAPARCPRPGGERVRLVGEREGAIHAGEPPADPMQRERQRIEDVPEVDDRGGQCDGVLKRPGDRGGCDQRPAGVG